MPLKNDVNKAWDGWLVDGLGGQEEAYQKALVEALESRNIPRCTVTSGTVNMWWRKESRYIDVTSTLDGSITSTIHLQEYGTSLWIGRALEASSQYNYYKRMAASAFVETIDRCIRETTLTMVDAAAIHAVEDIGKKSA
jgi:hypothetical protein